MYMYIYVYTHAYHVSDVGAQIFMHYHICWCIQHAGFAFSPSLELKTWTSNFPPVKPCGDVQDEWDPERKVRVYIYSKM